MNQPLSDADLLRARAADNIAQASDEQVTRLSVTEHIVVSVPASTEIYVVLQKPAKAISILRNELKSVLGDVNIIKNHYHGYYSFDTNVAIGECAVDKLFEIGNKTIADLAQLLQNQ